jgi:hypothetical protein
MGISLAWVAVKGLDMDTILSRLELEPTGRECDCLDVDVSAHPLPGDALLVTTMRCDHRIIEPDSMAKVSAGCQAIACAVEEHVNFSLCELWRDGRRIWQIQYVGCESPEEFTHEGELPPRFHELVAGGEPEDEEDSDGFLMDVPLILAKELGGFRHDEFDPAFDAVPFQELKDVRARPGWWKRLWS